jgi:site-specific recombinase XerD
MTAYAETITDLVPAQEAVHTALAFAMEQAHDYAKEAKAPNTRRAYRADWADFTAWCAAHALAALPASPETVALYLAARAADRKPSTLVRRLTAIAQAHKTAGHASPTIHPSVRQVVAGIRRAKGTAQEGKAAAVTREVRAMCEALPPIPTLRRRRDAALLLVGFAGAFRRSELVALDIADVRWTMEGLEVTIRRGKTDQEGHGRKIGLPYGSNPTSCPVRALRAWLDAAVIGDGPLFHGITRHDQVLPDRLSDKGVARVVKRAAAAAGLDPKMYSGHSLRAGLATAAAQAGISERAIMAQTGHKSIPMVRKYIRDGSLWRENAAAGVGL